MEYLWIKIKILPYGLGMRGVVMGCITQCSFFYCAVGEMTLHAPFFRNYDLLILLILRLSRI